MKSELFIEGITNFLCIGRTELKYCLQTSKGLLFRCLISLFNRLISLMSESISIKTFKENKFTMIWQDTGFLISKNKYNENSSISEFYTENHGKVTGFIFGSTSKKIKNYLLVGNKFYINFNSKHDGKLGYFKVEIDKINTPIFLDNKKKLYCIIYSMHLIKILTVDNQENKNIFYSVKKRSDFEGKKILIAGGGDSALDYVMGFHQIA